MRAYPHRMHEPRIESLANPLVKELRALRTPKGRDEQRRFFAEGEWMLSEAEAAGWRPQLLLVDGSTIRGAAQTHAHRAERVIETTSDVLAKITGRDNPQPLLAVFDEPTAAARSVASIDSTRARRWLLLEGPRDPGNLGSAIRSADAAAAGGVIIVGPSCDPYAIEVVRATMGSIFAVPLIRLGVEEAVQLVRRWPGATFAAALEGSVDYAQPNYAAPALLVIGSETDGLTPVLRDACTTVVRIPMLGRAESLNLAVAAALMLYTAERAQRSS